MTYGAETRADTSKTKRMLRTTEMKTDTGRSTSAGWMKIYYYESSGITYQQEEEP